MDLVINWHITEACNYQCFYCFAKWQKEDQRELLHSKHRIQQLIQEISLLPSILNTKNGCSFTGVRLNLVGGETFLYKHQILDIIEAAKNYHFRLSAITNGSLLNDELIEIIANEFSMIGFSIDSTHSESNLRIGRAIKNIPIETDKICSHIQKLRTINPEIDIKINSVINQFNKDEDLNNFIRKLSPSKWKVFKMLPVITNDHSINDSEFYEFLKRHSDLEDIISSENNDEMTHSYLMIDPLGRFFQNSSTSCGYDYSSEILISGISSALDEINFDISKFIKRSKLIPNIQLSTFDPATLA